jgi:hypothetical protein
MTKQEVDGHFTQKTADWLLALLQRAVLLVVTAKAVPLPLLQRFTSVLVEDGSTIQLPASLKQVWQGCGGNSRHLVFQDGIEPQTDGALGFAQRNIVRPLFARWQAT